LLAVVGHEIVIDPLVAERRVAVHLPQGTLVPER
jgi:hypothetical protein